MTGLALLLGQAHATAFCIYTGFAGNTLALCMAGEGWEQRSGEDGAWASPSWQACVCDGEQPIMMGWWRNGEALGGLSPGCN